MTPATLYIITGAACYAIGVVSGWIANMQCISEMKTLRHRTKHYETTIRDLNAKLSRMTQERLPNGRFK